jgi:P pilus assembly chaperone PapD
MTSLAMIRNSLRLCAAALLAFASVQQGSATSVSPMVVDLQSTGRGVVANVSVTNTADKPLTMEVGTVALEPRPDGLSPGDGSADDLLVVPPTALIPPGQTQTFRIQWIGDPEPAISYHYYVGLNQLPVQLPEGESAVQIVYNFNVLVSVGATDGKAALVVQSSAITEREGKPAPSVTVSNSGDTYGYLTQRSLKIVQTDSSGKEVFNRTLAGNEFQQLVGYGLVATGQTRTMVLPIELPSATGTLTATLLDERGP